MDCKFTKLLEVLEKQSALDTRAAPFMRSGTVPAGPVEPEPLAVDEDVPMEPRGEQRKQDEMSVSTPDGSGKKPKKRTRSHEGGSMAAKCCMEQCDDMGHEPDEQGEGKRSVTGWLLE